jgi:hypothetical protein
VTENAPTTVAPEPDVEKRSERKEEEHAIGDRIRMKLRRTRDLWTTKTLSLLVLWKMLMLSRRRLSLRSLNLSPSPRKSP